MENTVSSGTEVGTLFRDTQETVRSHSSKCDWLGLRICSNNTLRYNGKRSMVT